MNIRYSIITVTYNNLDGLQATYDSICKQLYNEIQWVVIDGNSSDDTRKFLESLNLADFDFNWISEEDSGIYNAMNKGVRLSKGDYLIFLNAGDIFADINVLKNLSKLENLSEYDIIYGDSYERLNKKIFYKKARSAKSIWYGMFAHHQSIFYNRNLLISDPYSEDLIIAADYEITARLLYSNHCSLYVNMPVCIFTAGGLSSTCFSIGLREQMNVRIKVLRFPKVYCYLLYILQYSFWIIRNYFPSIYVFYRKKV